MPVAHQKIAKVHATLTGTIPPGDSVDLDTLPLVEFSFTKYIIRLFNTAQAKHRGLELVASKKSGGVSDQVYSTVGDSLDVDVNFTTAATDTLLRLANNESYPVSYTILKYLL